MKNLKSNDNNEIKSHIDENKITTFLFSILKGFTDLWIALPDISIEKIINDNIKWYGGYKTTRSDEFC